MMTAACSSISAYAQEYPKAEVFGGFSVLSAYGVQAPGWQASVAGNVHKHFGVVADFGGQYKQGVQVYQYLFGPRFRAQTGRTTLFVHGLLGGATARSGGDTANGFAMGLGGGVDIGITKKVAVRVLQLDWVPTRFEGAWLNGIGRAGFGIVLK